MTQRHNLNAKGDWPFHQRETSSNLLDVTWDTRIRCRPAFGVECDHERPVRIWQLGVSRPNGMPYHANSPSLPDPLLPPDNSPARTPPSYLPMEGRRGVQIRGTITLPLSSVRGRADGLNPSQPDPNPSSTAGAERDPRAPCPSSEDLLLLKTIESLVDFNRHSGDHTVPSNNVLGKPIRG
jgi:hypothetical protein